MKIDPYTFFRGAIDELVSHLKTQYPFDGIPGSRKDMCRGRKNMKRIVKSIIALSLMTVLIMPLPVLADSKGCGVGTVGKIDTFRNLCTQNPDIFKNHTYKANPSKCEDSKDRKCRDRKVEKLFSIQKAPIKVEAVEKPGEVSKAESNKKPVPEKTEKIGAAAGTQEQQILTLVNKERAVAGLSPLTMNGELSKVAKAKAADMRDKGYFSHTSPTYGSPFDMMKTFGIKYSTAGENIAKGYPGADAVMRGWMNSEGHKANILNVNFTQLGVGYVTDESGTGYWVQMFIRP